MVTPSTKLPGSKGSSEGDDAKKRLAEFLEQRLKLHIEHRETHYDHKWLEYERHCKGEHKRKYNVEDKNENWRSEVFYNITEQKRQSAIAQIDEAHSGNGAFPIALEQTPVTDSADETSTNKELQDIGLDMEKYRERSEMKLMDQLVQSKSRDELRRIVDDCSKYGVGVVMSLHVIDGFKRQVTYEATEEMPALPPAEVDEDGIERETPETLEKVDEFVRNKVIYTGEILPTTTYGIKRISPWDFFPDPNCEGDAQKGVGHFIRERVRKTELRKMAEEKDLNGDYKYDRDVILEVLSDKKRNSTISEKGDREDDPFETNDKPIEIYTYYGEMTRKDFKQFSSGTVLNDQDKLTDYDFVEVKAEFIQGGYLLRIEPTTSPTNRRPIEIIQWTKVAGAWCGRGIPELLYTIQIEINRFLRLFADNKSLASSVVLGVKAEELDDEDDLAMYPGKIFMLKGAQALRDIFDQLIIDDLSDKHIAAFGHLLQLADNESGIPRIFEGQSDIKNQTAFEVQQQEAHALKQMGRVIQNIDEAVENAIETLYQFMLVNGIASNWFQGDFDIRAQGLTRFDSKRVRLNMLNTMLVEAAQNEAVQRELDMRAIVRDKMKIVDNMATKYLLSEEDLKARDKKEAEQAQAAQQQAIQAQMAIEQAKSEAKLQEIQIKAQADAEIKKQELDQEMRIKLLEIEEGRRNED